MLPTLDAGEAHTWRVSLDVSRDTTARLYATLSGDERNRSARLRFGRDRQHFIVAHGAMREVLGCYLAVQPGHIRFVYNEFGKPSLGPELGSALNFNLSHSAGLALIAIVAGADIGVDLEYIRPQFDYDEIARCCFSAADVENLRSVPAHRYAAAFLACWTKKEAYVKARGEGLAMPLPSFSGRRLHRAWSIYSLRPAAGFVGALAIEGSRWRVRHRHWHASVHDHQRVAIVPRVNT
ncbi:MAG TPA: 4'-phosphopantetheinyl transferase superfamily protein [Gemmatimonadales bacterium]|nr:4'-phosphopantetheinyl transferase superfamily protein [Gemmatimonadales bacterium]